MYANILALTLSLIFAYLSIKYSRKSVVASTLSILLLSMFLIFPGVLIYEGFKTNLSFNDKAILYICTVCWIIVAIKNIAYDVFRIVRVLFIFNNLVRSSDIAKEVFRKNGVDATNCFAVIATYNKEVYWVLVKDHKNPLATTLSAINYNGEKVETSNVDFRFYTNTILVIKSYKFKQVFVSREYKTYLEIM